jgi:hypothetical protein
MRRRKAGLRAADESIVMNVSELEELLQRAAELGARRVLDVVLQDGVPVVALPTMRAARSLGVGHDVFRKDIAPYLECIRVNSKPLYPLTELQRWADEHAEPTLPGGV